MTTLQTYRNDVRPLFRRNLCDQNCFRNHVFYLFVFTCIITLNSCYFIADVKKAETNEMVLVEGKSDKKKFWIGKTPVTVAMFSKFVTATKYRTEAEIFGAAGVFDTASSKWHMVDGANWRFPLGPDGETAKSNHPVTQVSWNDANAYCRWSGMRLPTIAEFKLAAKNGDSNYESRYPWGDSIVSCGIYQVNAWQGEFPLFNTIADKYLYTAPVGITGRNRIGLTDMGGNVWQWMQDWHPKKPFEKAQSGGSFLCDPKVCHGFQIGEISSSSPETSLMHVGFRCVRDF